MAAARAAWRVLKLMVLGAAGFWLPDTLWHAIRGFRFNARDVRGITILMPLVFLATYVLIKRACKSEPRRLLGWPLVLGVWLFGGLFMAIGASFSGGGFASPQGLAGVAEVLLLSVMPPYTFIMATYDGSLFALLAISFGALVVWLVSASGISRRLRTFIA
jgi:hypothetical protein